MLGFQIKTQFDYDRIQINDEYNPIYVRHLSKTAENVNEWSCLYGIDLPLPSNIRLLYHSLSNTTEDLDEESYNDILGLYRLSCNDNYLLLRKNLFPIDVRHISTLIDDPLFEDYTTLRKLLVLPEGCQWYMNWSEFKIFLLS